MSELQQLSNELVAAKAQAAAYFTLCQAFIYLHPDPHKLAEYFEAAAQGAVAHAETGNALDVRRELFQGAFDRAYAGIRRSIEQAKARPPQ